MTDSVSLIVPCHDHAQTLARAVASGLVQGVLEEIIIVDDHSTDTSLETARELARKDARIRVIRTADNIGPGGARNIGVRAATGSHVSFLDADDELIGDFFSEALTILSAYPEMRAVKGEMEFFDPVKGYILPEFDPRHKSAVLSSSCGMVMERALFLRMGGFPEDAIFRGPLGGEDVAFMQVVMEHFQPIGRIERPCYRVWSQAGSHVDKFLARTCLKDDGFAFIASHPEQKLNEALAQAMKRYFSAVNDRLG